ncbi:uroporphyrinogen-III synthase [Chitinophaga japonensis]|uniref:Uroporphyrinogen-III synthase n=1 Tax=Chitinophaga japonensis TaxID=104662 RepID=A0A562SMY1_CHIJA|nr:uroporphyrinogen-III synthase [Chitinophaga japonensis]TWI82046.1 uroporphyrinogen-III synthase [Chitinophaga japonensis]
MQNERPRILCTRPLSGHLLEKAAGQGLDISVQAFTDIQPVITEELWGVIEQLLPQHITAVFTSAHAGNIMDRYLHQGDTFYVVSTWDICCLEGATLQAVQEALRECNFRATAANATALAYAIVQLGDVQEVYFFCSRQRRDELPAILSAHGIRVHEIVLYENVPTPVVTTSDYDGMFFFSPSAVTSFFSVNRLPRHTVCFAIGQTTAAALEDFTDNRIIISTAPSAESMVQTAIFYFNNINCYE